MREYVAVHDAVVRLRLGAAVAEVGQQAEQRDDPGDLALEGVAVDCGPFGDAAGSGGGRQGGRLP
jgi:hypothetical protein